MRFYTFIRVLVLLFGLLQTYASMAQVPIGAWQLHVPYRQGKAVTVADGKVYAVVEQGLFYYDKEFNSTKAITKSDGLREQEISAIAYDIPSQTLILAYGNTYIDLLQNNTFHTISDIFRKNLPGEKKINHIYTFNQKAYLATTFGVVVLDIAKKEIRDTYSNLGSNGEQISILASTIHNESLYLATSIGVLKGQLNGPNLQDFRNWTLVSNGLPQPGSITALVTFNDAVYAGTAAGLYKYTNEVWQSTSITQKSILALHSSSDHLTITTPEHVLLLDRSGTIAELTDELVQAPKDAVVDDNIVWVADGRAGLIQKSIVGGAAEVFTPGGPYAGDAFSLKTEAGKLFAFGGNYNENYNQVGNTNGYSVYQNGTWQSYNRFIDAAFPDDVQDIVDGVYDAVTGNLYLASLKSGLIVWDGKTYTSFNSSNSPLQSSIINPVHTPVTSIARDAEGNIWAVNPSLRAGVPGLFKLTPDQEITGYSLPNIADGTSLEQLLIDDNGYKWLTGKKENSAGIVVFDEKQHRTRRLSTGKGSGNLPGGAVYAMVKDTNGDIWAGTSQGVAVFYNPGSVFESQPYEAHLPIIDRRPLLDGQRVLSIAIDGANRKWVGTDNGLWLFGPDGDELVSHFTTKNSPLPSDRVHSVAVEHRSGNVFVATAAGIASYRAGATITEGTPDCAVVFPNPVKKSFTGLVAISNLPNNAEVHITDISGALVYKTKATGGTATWDVRDYNGDRAKAGVYLVLSSNADCKQTCISKIAVLQ
ncbi:T9SS type A sorting domain-containing protein [Pontibacter sp. KCTC 32443]|uniref:type IX secretion system anionic LPS delivery protein PorZ n=1 Tax=Pontibacter TaxID=323449 RepID=UPI00164D5E23|nr:MULTISPECIES: two-component regulator propeller domain-containing protein [Pontibacter]MBC5774198.1 T9SS type A sorting domain-containing protein [Pontibacter sp. KCTC 32443]